MGVQQEALEDQGVEDQMVDHEETGEENEGQEDVLKNFKTEFSRKLENQNKQIEALLQTLQQSNRQPAPQSQEEEVDLEELAYSDPKRYAEVIEERATKRIQGQIQQREQNQQQIAGVVQQYQSMYPEFRDANSQAYQKAISIYNSIPADQQNAQAAKLAFLEAVAEAGLVAVDKRKKKDDETEDFTMSGKGGASNRSKGKSKDDVEISEGTLAFAKAMNPGKSEKDLIAGLKETAKRKNWNKWS